MKPHCLHYSKLPSGCSGCDFESQELATQTKVSALRSRLYQALGYLPQNTSTLALDDSAIRSRLDIQIQNGSIGLYNNEKSAICDMSTCAILHPELLSFFQEIKPILSSLVQKGSARLRVGPHNQKGLWLDFSHKDTQALFKKPEALWQLSQICSVEWGQRRKALVFNEGSPKLLKHYPKLPTLFSTLVGTQVFDLNLHIADFTQPSIQMNLEMIRQYQNILIQYFSKAQAYEFGCGIGNLSFAAAPILSSLKCYDWDPYSALSFHENYQRLQSQFGYKNIEHFLGDAAKNQTTKKAPSSVDLLLLNPSRSGVGKFISSYIDLDPKGILYLSCYPETLLQDMLPFSKEYKCEELIFIDQFPFSNHLEVLTLWLKK